MEISRVITAADFDLEQIDSDLIITTIQIPKLMGREAIHLNPFIMEEDIQRIQNSITKIKKERSHHMLKSHLISLFDPIYFNKTFS